jgi:hypothetical protein
MDEWLQLFQSKRLVPIVDERPRVVDMLMVDGPCFIDAAIARSTSPKKLSRDLAKHVEDLVRDFDAAECVVFFDSALHVPNARPAPWAHNTRAQTDLKTHLESLLEENQASFSACLHGDAGSTEWPRPVFKEVGNRAVLWRHPLYEWQLVHAAANELVAWQHYPPSLRRLSVTSTPTIQRRDKWTDVWKAAHQTVSTAFATHLDTIRQQGGMFGKFEASWTAFYLTNLHLGYSQPGVRESKHSAMAPMEKIDSTADIYTQASQVLYNLVNRGGDDTPTTKVVYFENARDEALWSFLFVMHRVRASQHDLRLLVTFARSPTLIVDMGSLYDNLSTHLGVRCPAVTVRDLLVVMAIQSDQGVGATPHESSVIRTWELIGQVGERLTQTYAIHYNIDPIRDITALGMTSEYDRPSNLAWCASNIDVKMIATIALLVSTSCLLETLQIKHKDHPLKLTHRWRQTVSVGQSVYRQFKLSLPEAWWATLPLGPREALARARRVHWKFEYAYAASMPAHLTVVRDHAMYERDNWSYWGYQYSLERPVIGSSLLDTFFDDRLRLRSADPLNTRTPSFNLVFFQRTDLIL